MGLAGAAGRPETDRAVGSTSAALGCAAPGLEEGLRGEVPHRSTAPQTAGKGLLSQPEGSGQNLSAVPLQYTCTLSVGVESDGILCCSNAGRQGRGTNILQTRKGS